MKHAKAFALVAAVLATLVAVPLHAQQSAYVSKEVNLRAGPSSDYPVVAILGGGVAITVEGCISDYRWCDVSVGAHRGWLYAGNIVYPYQGAGVPLLTYGAAIGIGVVAFSVGSYWDDYYRFRPWYPQRQRWIDRHDPVYPVHPVHPALRPGFQHPPHNNHGFNHGFNNGFGHPARPDIGHHPLPPQVLVPVPRPLHGPRPGFDHRPPQAHGPIHGHPPGFHGQAAVPRPHHGMRRGEGHRPDHGQGGGQGAGQGHGAGRHP